MTNPPAVPKRSAEVEALREEISRIDARVERLELGNQLSRDMPFRIRFVRELLCARRQRDIVFGTDLFGEPAWDILLELYLAELEHREILVSKVGREQGLSQTTTLRWIEKLEAAGIAARATNPRRNGSTFIVLTARASNALRTYVDDVLSRCPSRDRES